MIWKLLCLSLFTFLFLYSKKKSSKRVSHSHCLRSLPLWSLIKLRVWYCNENKRERKRERYRNLYDTLCVCPKCTVDSRIYRHFLYYICLYLLQTNLYNDIYKLDPIMFGPCVDAIIRLYAAVSKKKNKQRNVTFKFKQLE